METTEIVRRVCDLQPGDIFKLSLLSPFYRVLEITDGCIYYRIATRYSDHVKLVSNKTTEPAEAFGVRSKKFIIICYSSQNDPSLAARSADVSKL